MSYPLPKISRIISNAGKAVKKAASTAITTGRLKVDQKTAKSRLSFCQGCEYYIQDAERCSHESCGCYVRIKAWMYSERCPAGKW